MEPRELYSSTPEYSETSDHQQCDGRRLRNDRCNQSDIASSQVVIRNRSAVRSRHRGTFCQAGELTINVAGYIEKQQVATRIPSGKIDAKGRRTASTKAVVQEHVTSNVHRADVSCIGDEIYRSRAVHRKTTVVTGNREIRCVERDVAAYDIQCASRTIVAANTHQLCIHITRAAGIECAGHWSVLSDAQLIRVNRSTGQVVGTIGASSLTNIDPSPCVQRSTRLVHDANAVVVYTKAVAT